MINIKCFKAVACAKRTTGERWGMTFLPCIPLSDYMTVRRLKQGTNLFTSVVSILRVVLRRTAPGFPNSQNVKRNCGDAGSCSHHCWLLHTLVEPLVERCESILVGQGAANHFHLVTLFVIVIKCLDSATSYQRRSSLTKREVFRCLRN